jgi:hypothetical protein
MSSYADKIASLRERLHDVSKQLASLTDRRKSFALAAVEGDAQALKQIGDVDFETDALRKSAATLGSALETAQALERQHELEAQQAEQQAFQRTAREHAQAIIATHAALDALLIQLRECFERRALHLRALGNTGVVDPGLIMKLCNRAGPTSAAHHAGLGRHLNLEMVPNVSQRPLADSNSVLSGIGTKSNGKGSNAK